MGLFWLTRLGVGNHLERAIYEEPPKRGACGISPALKPEPLIGAPEAQKSPLEPPTPVSHAIPFLSIERRAPLKREAGGSWEPHQLKVEMEA